MKLFYTVSLSLACAFATAQNKSDGISLTWSSPFAAIPAESERAAFDTLYTPNIYGLALGNPVSGCEEIGIYSDGSGGYVGGNNSHGDLEKMQKYHTTNLFGVFQTLVLFVHKSVANPDSLIYSNIYSVDPVTHGPGELIFTSDPQTLGQIYADPSIPNFTAFHFPSTIPVGDSFFVSYTLPRGTGDTLVAATSTDGCYPNHQVAWEMESDSSFRAFNDGTGNSWGLNVELFMAPVVELQTSNGEVLPLTYKGITLLGTYPVPANDFVTVAFELKELSDVQVQVVDLTGKLISTKNIGATQGYNEVKLDASSLPSGIYNYGIRFGNEFIFSRFTKQ